MLLGETVKSGGLDGRRWCVDGRPNRRGVEALIAPHQRRTFIVVVRDYLWETKGWTCGRAPCARVQARGSAVTWVHSRDAGVWCRGMGAM